MAKSPAELRREKLRNRQKQAVDTKDQKGLGRKSVLDWSRLTGKKPLGFTPTAGKEKNLVDFLPFVVTQSWYKDLRTFSGLTTNLDVGDWDYKCELPVHSNVGENNDVFLCLRLAFGQKCPRCEDMFLEYEKAEPDEKVTKALKPSWRDWYNVYDYSEEGNPDGVNGIWEDASYYLFEKEILNEADEGEETVLYSDIELGKSVEIKGKEKVLGKNKFIEAGSVEFKDREAYGEDIVNDTVSFDALVKIPTYEEFRNAHLGLDEDGNETADKDDDSEPEVDKKTTPRRRGSTADTSKNKPEKDTAPWEDGDGCPHDELVFGEPSDSTECKECPDAIFSVCSALADENETSEKVKTATAKEEPEEVKEVEKEVEETKTPVRRRRKGK